MTNIMKHKFLVLLVAVVYLGCGDDFTNLSPISDRNSASFYNTQSDFEIALYGAYNMLQNKGTFGVNYILFMEMRADNTGNGAGASGLSATLEQIDRFQEIATASELKDTWAASYAGIASCNTIIDRIDGVDFTSQTIKDQYKGEALFIRSLLYYHLALIFGNIPYQFEAVTSPDIKINQVPASEILAKLAIDLAEAETLLSPSAYEGRATSGAAAALLGRVYLAMGDKASAVAPLKRVVDSGVYKLVDDYANLWGPANEHNAESIFEIEFLAGGKGEGSAYTDMYTNMGLAGGIGGGAAPQSVTDDIINAYEAGDKRYTATIDDTDPTSIWVKKYASTPYGVLDADNNFIEIRYAEVLLMLAEALGETPEAYTYINQVRTRAGLGNISSSTPGTFEEKLMHERRVEFAFESKRWPDLLRFGKAKSVMSAHLGIPEANVSLLLPIPQSELDVSPDEMVQNPEHIN